MRWIDYNLSVFEKLFYPSYNTLQQIKTKNHLLVFKHSKSYSQKSSRFYIAVWINEYIVSTGTNANSLLRNIRMPHGEIVWGRFQTSHRQGILFYTINYKNTSQ